MVSAPLQLGKYCDGDPQGLARSIRHSVLSSLSRLQLGACVKGGCEAIIHAVSHVMLSSTPSQHWMLLLDFSNAFNNISRETMFVETRRRSPTISAWMESCYSCQPFLLGKDSIRSCCGVQQGDPLGPLGFALTLRSLIEKVKAELPGLTLNAWYLDDGTLMGPPKGLAAALHIVERDGPSLVLHLNMSKSLLFIPENADVSQSPLPSDIPVIRHGFSLLGCPIDPLTFAKRCFRPNW